MTPIMHMDSSILGQRSVSRSLAVEIVTRLSALHAELAEMARSLDALESSFGTGAIGDAIGDQLDALVASARARS